MPKGRSRTKKHIVWIRQVIGGLKPREEWDKNTQYEFNNAFTAQTNHASRDTHSMNSTSPGNVMDSWQDSGLLIEYEFDTVPATYQGHLRTIIKTACLYMNCTPKTCLSFGVQINDTCHLYRAKNADYFLSRSAIQCGAPRLSWKQGQWVPRRCKSRQVRNIRMDTRPMMSTANMRKSLPLL